MNEPQTVDLIYLIASGLIYTLIFAIVVIYFLVWRKVTVPVLLIIAIMLVNQLLEALCEILGYLADENNVICCISLIGRTAFTISATFWVIFITRMMYKQKSAPGKYLNMFKYVSKNILLTYAPSIIISAFLLVVINVNDSPSEQSCWRIPHRKGALDYIIYFTCFVMPYLVGSIILSLYLCWYIRLPKFTFNLFLFYPVCSIAFSTYYFSVKIYLFLEGLQSPNIIELPVMAQSLIYAIVFVVLCITKAKKQLDDDTVTLKDNSVSQSFLQDS